MLIQILIVLCDMIAYMLSNKKLEPIITDLFIRGKKHFACFHYTIILCGPEKNLD